MSERIIFDRADFMCERFELDSVMITEKGISIVIALIVPMNIMQMGGDKVVMYLVNEMRNIEGRGINGSCTNIDLKKGVATIKMEVIKKEIALKTEKPPAKKSIRKESAIVNVNDKKVCSVEGCHGVIKARGLCAKCYQQDRAKRYIERG